MASNNGKQAIECLLARAKSSSVGKDFRRDLDGLPVMHGLTAVREIRRMEASGDLPKCNLIFALTGNTRSAQVQNAYDAGIDDVFIKPYKLDQLLSKIRSSVTLH